MMRVSLIFATILALAALIVALPDFNYHHHQALARRASEAAAAAPVELAARADEQALVNTRDVQLEARKKNKKHKKKWTVKSGKITWYDGHELDNPSCGGGRPNDDDFVCAVSYESGIPCHAGITIKYHGHNVTCIVRDHCEDCPWYHVDVTTGTFQELEPDLDVGVLENVKYHVKTQ